MKVILLENVARLGQKYDVKEVPQGHALNFLIPKQLAKPATKKNLERIESMKAEQASASAEAVAAFEAALQKAGDTAIELPAPANESGSLYEGVNAHAIAEHLQANGLQVPEQAIQLNAPIKEAGEHELTLSFGDAQGTLKLTIIPKK